MQTITFYSYKGGTGRSLALANAAIYLARLEFKVVALDLDLEAPGLHYKFSKSENGEPLRVEFGAVDYLCRFIADGDLPKSIEDFTLNVDVPGNDRPLLQLIAAGKAPSAEYWAGLARLDWHELFYSKNATGVQLLLDLKNRIQDEISPDFLLIDSRTGITEMAGVATTLLADKIVCLVLPTLENLDGARAVLRSLRRSRRESELEDIEVMVALSRLPSSEPEGEKTLTEKIRKFLSKEAEDLRDTVISSDIFVLHRESALEVSESLRVGSGISPDESILLRDYLRLFATVVPKHLIETKVDGLIKLAKEKLWENPEGAVKEVEELAESFGHPETYRALLRFYEIRNISGGLAMKKAQRLWEITRDSHDQLLWQTIKSALVWFQQQDFDDSDEWHPNLDFVEAVWRGAGQSESAFGLILATAWEEQEKQHRAADVCLEILSKWGPEVEVASRAIRLLDTSNRVSEADSVIQDAKAKLSSDPMFVEAWAKHVLTNEDKDAMSELLQPQPIETLRRSEPILAARLYLKFSMNKEAAEIADDALRSISRNRRLGPRSAAIYEAAELFDELGRWEDFERSIRGKFPPSYLDELRERLNIKRQSGIRG